MSIFKNQLNRRFFTVVLIEGLGRFLDSTDPRLNRHELLTLVLIDFDFIWIFVLLFSLEVYSYCLTVHWNVDLVLVEVAMGLLIDLLLVVLGLGRFDQLLRYSLLV